MGPFEVHLKRVRGAERAVLHGQAAAGALELIAV
jgi:hypothetical protein